MACFVSSRQRHKYTVNYLTSHVCTTQHRWNSNAFSELLPSEHTSPPQDFTHCIKADNHANAVAKVAVRKKCILLYNTAQQCKCKQRTAGWACLCCWMLCIHAVSSAHTRLADQHKFCLAVILHRCSARRCLSTCCVIAAQQRNKSKYIPSNPSIHAAELSPHGHAVCNMHCSCLEIKPGLATLVMHCKGCSQNEISVPTTHQTLA
jgi:hypothetical protein